MQLGSCPNARPDPHAWGAGVLGAGKPQAAAAGVCLRMKAAVSAARSGRE